MKINELTVSFKNGALTGVSVRGADGVQRGLQSGDLAAQLATLNESALLSVDALKAVQAELDATKEQGRQAAQAVLDATNKQQCNEIARGILKNKRQRDREAALKEVAAAQAKADALA